MPAFDFEYTGDNNLSHKIDQKVKAGFNPSKPTKIDEKIQQGSHNQILLTKIGFTETKMTHNLQLQQLKSKYTIFNASSEKQNDTVQSENKLPGKMLNCNNHNSTPKTNDTVSISKKKASDGIPTPKKILFDPQRLDFGPIKLHHVGPGLGNMGNTCFVNSIIQALTYCPPLFNYLLSDHHVRTCNVVGFCALCELKRHMKRIVDHQNGGQTSITPQAILIKLRAIAKHFQWGRQEDAHEFLRYMVDAMQRACLNGYKDLDHPSKETTLVNQLFGGFLRSQIICLVCGYISSTYDGFMDLSLDIKHCDSVSDALTLFVRAEKLFGGNAYNCEKCRKKQNARKAMSIHRAPNVLTIQLKRFSIISGKINKHVSFSEALNLRPYMTQRQGAPVTYRLYSIVQHCGRDMGFGHYQAYCCARNKQWYLFNDSRVNMVPKQRVFASEAYLLFYVKDKATQHHSHADRIGPSPKPTGINMNSNNKSNVSATVTSNASGKRDLDVNRKILMTPTSDKTSKLVNGAQGYNSQLVNKSSTPSQPLPEKRSKISFDIGVKKSLNASFEKASPVLKPEAKGAQAVTLEKHSSPMLVPYGEDSSDSEEENKLPESDGKKLEDSGGPVKKSSIKRKADQLGIVQHKRSPDANCDISVEMDNKLKTTDIVPGSLVPLSKLVDAHTPNNKYSQDLTLITTPTKVKSTTPRWHVRTFDALVSPSIHSDVSNASVGSTSEWHVEDRSIKLISPVIPEGQHAGWKVEDKTVSKPDGLKSRTENASERFKYHSDSDNCHLKNSYEVRARWNDEAFRKESEDQFTEVQHHRKSKLENGTDCFNHDTRINASDMDRLLESPPDKKHKKNKFEFNIFKKSKSDSSIVDAKNSQKYSRLSESDIGENDDEYHKKKAKKHKYPDEEENSRKKSKKKHKKDKHKHRDDNYKKIKKDKIHDSKELESSRKYIDDYSKAEMESFNKHQHRHNSSRSSSPEHSRHKHHHDRSSRHKRHKHRSSSSSSDSDHHERHGVDKGKHRCDRDEKDQWGSSSPEKRRQKHEHGSDNRGKRSSSTDHKHQSNDKKHRPKPDDYKVEWVEMTKEKAKTVETKHWDSLVKDGYKRPRSESHEKSFGKSWDGSKTSSVVDKLESSNLHGYGSSVLSWNGGQNQLDCKIDRDQTKSSKCKWEDDYEEEFDRGKTKKVKSSHTEKNQHGDHNLFQKYQDDKNWTKQQMTGTYSTSIHGQRAHHNGFDSKKNKYN